MELAELENSLKHARSQETCYPKLANARNTTKASLGQCAVTALIIQDVYGGDIVYNKRYNHYWNKLPDGEEVDITKDQFPGDPQILPDCIVTRDEVLYSN